ncbi:hypothetical protein EZS27_039868, partial [termite gut metagenome]
SFQYKGTKNYLKPYTPFAGISGMLILLPFATMPSFFFANALRGRINIISIFVGNIVFDFPPNNMRIALLIVFVLMLDIFAIIEVRRSKINDSLKSLITLVILLLPLIGFSVYYIVKTLGKSK